MEREDTRGMQMSNSEQGMSNVEVGVVVKYKIGKQLQLHTAPTWNLQPEN
jgi:hypothetical protein